MQCRMRYEMSSFAIFSQLEFGHIARRLRCNIDVNFFMKSMLSMTVVAWISSILIWLVVFMRASHCLVLFFWRTIEVVRNDRSSGNVVETRWKNNTTLESEMVRSGANSLQNTRKLQRWVKYCFLLFKAVVGLLWPSSYRKTIWVAVGLSVLVSFPCFYDCFFAGPQESYLESWWKGWWRGRWLSFGSLMFVRSIRSPPGGIEM